ncbi:MAG TPA: hypothetical protein DCE42_09485, partial [Myxococcales bacterium]|nr:hypothetical protein [Myxococcales bacterium]
PTQDTEPIDASTPDPLVENQPEPHHESPVETDENPNDGGLRPEEPSPEHTTEEALVEQTPKEEIRWQSFLKCGGEWVYSLRDPNHCGSCGNQCAQGERCCGGLCAKGSAEVCNGKDDDCDGTIDEGLTNCVSTYAGTDLSVNGPALWTPLSGPMGLTVDKKGNVYIAERNRFRVRKLSPDGLMTTIAGSGRYSIAGIGKFQSLPPLSVSFPGPTTLRLNPAEDTLYVLQNPQGIIWRVPLQGTGNALFVSGLHLSVPVLDVTFSTPTFSYLISFAGGRIYTYDWGTQKLTHFAGAGTGTGDGQRLKARFYDPCCLAQDSKGIVHIAETSAHKIRNIINDTTTTVAGSGFEGAQNGFGTQASFSEPRQIVFDKSDQLYVADAGNHLIRKLASSGQVSNFAGSSAGYSDGSALQAQFFWPTGIVQDPQGNTYIADTGNQLIRKLDPQGNVTTIAGARSFRDSALHKIQLNEPMGLAFDTKGTLFVADAENQRVLTFDKQGKTKILMGSGAQTFLRIAPNKKAGPLAAKPKHLWFPSDIAINKQGDIAIVSTIESRVVLISSTGTYFLWGALTGTSAVDGGPSVARFRYPRGLTYAQDGTLWIADTENHQLRKIDAKNKAVTTMAGTGKAGFTNGDAKQARFNEPEGLLIDEARQRLFIADTKNHKIRVYDLQSQKVSTFAGSTEGYKDGTASSAQFRTPTGLAWGPNRQSIYIADKGNHSIRKLTLQANGDAGTVSTYLGNGTPGHADGTVSAARFNAPSRIRWSPSGTLFISDTNNHLLRTYHP